MRLNSLLPYFEDVAKRVHSPLASTFSDIDPFFSIKSSDFLHSAQFQVDICEDEKNLIVSSNLPGVHQDDLNLQIDGDILTIKGEIKSEQKGEKDYHMRERFYGTFRRSLRLPFTPEFEDINAELKNGILKIQIQKSLRTKSLQKKIMINADE